MATTSSFLLSSTFGVLSSLLMRARTRVGSTAARTSDLLRGSSDPLFLTVTEVNQIHDEQVAEYGGIPGVRDDEALDAAVHMPQQTFDGAYVHSDLFEMAAAYVFHIALDHPYVDGNKRTAGESGDVFLFMNGYELAMPEEDYERFLVAVAAHEYEKIEIAEYLRRHCKSR